MKTHRLAIIFAIMLVNMLALGIVVPLLPYLAEATGASEFQTGLLVATYPLSQLFGAPLLGRLSDRFGRKPVLVASVLGTAIGFVVLAVARVLPVLFLGRMIDGLTGGNINVAQAYITDVTDRAQRGRALGLIGAAFGLGFVIGPVAGGLLAEISYATPAWLGAGLALLNMLAVLLFLPESLSAEARAKMTARKLTLFDVPAFRHALSHPRVRPVLTVRFITGVSFAIFETMFALWAMAALGFQPSQTGIFLGYLGVLSAIVQGGLMGRLTRRFADDTLLMTSVLVTGASLCVWGFVANIPLLVLLVPPLAFGLAVGQTTMTSMLSKSVGREEVGSVLGIQTSIMSLTRVIAPIIGGFLLENATVWSPGLLAGVLTLGIAPYAWKSLCLAPGRASCEASFDDE
ncbi:MAG TPA: MFS transporter [Coriobacteriia bacterium]|uniref:MFS transporter n=1 Tax=Anaerosoma tenue TaxID=2933588 RepID=UPI00076D7CB2|nr:MFS transporter [Anaerosoma tenue]KUK47961.1 MAG: Putative major facilitator superfamily transporter [Actinobacteria bacterium 66_15]MCK8115324.1 MFS transporter [Anaerosoma tenue]HAL31003.1 MFS transporter [Coriobacteriia bacterium]